MTKNQMGLLWLFLAITVCDLTSAAVVWNTKYTINPSATDPNIVDSQSGENGLGPHTVYVNLSSPSVAGQPLFVFLPGTAVQSDVYEYMLNMGASIGWKAIGLAWNNTHDPIENALCGSSGYFVQDCQIEYRLDTLIGGTYTNDENSVTYRLYKLLLYLHQQHPTQGWNSFFNRTDATASVSESALVWNRTAWGGHSQGAGTAQLVGMRYPIRRVLEIAPSGIVTTYPATTYTLLNSYYLFVHDRDSTEFVVDGIISIGPLTDFGGTVFYVDGETSFPSNTLKTNSTSTACAVAHSCVAMDTNLQKDDNGYPVFEPVWKYMLGTPIYLDASVTPTPSVSPSATPSRSPSGTPSVSRTPSTSPPPSKSASPSKTPSKTASPSSTPSKTPSPSRTPSKSVSPSRTPSKTPSPVSPSATPSPVSPSSTPSASPTPVSPSSTPSSSPVPVSPSVTPSPSNASVSPHHTTTPVVISNAGEISPLTAIGFAAIFVVLYV